jgi:hypothetical protein
VPADRDLDALAVAHDESVPRRCRRLSFTGRRCRRRNWVPSPTAADVHARALADVLQRGERLDLAFVVVVGGLAMAENQPGMKPNGGGKAIRTAPRRAQPGAPRAACGGRLGILPWKNLSSHSRRRGPRGARGNRGANRQLLGSISGVTGGAGRVDPAEDSTTGGGLKPGGWRRISLSRRIAAPRTAAGRRRPSSGAREPESEW